MLIVLAAWIFWLMLYGKLGTYAGFATTSNPSGTLGAVLGKAWASLTSGMSVKQALAKNTAINPPAIGQPGSMLANGIPTPQSYFAGLPASDQGILPSLSAVFGNAYPSGLPNYRTLSALNNRALGNIAAGAPGL